MTVHFSLSSSTGAMFLAKPLLTFKRLRFCHLCVGHMQALNAGTPLKDRFQRSNKRKRCVKKVVKAYLLRYKQLKFEY